MILFPDGKEYNVAPLTYNPRTITLFKKIEDAQESLDGGVAGLIAALYEVALGCLQRGGLSQEAAEAALGSVPINEEGTELLKKVIGI